MSTPASKPALALLLLLAVTVPFAARAAEKKALPPARPADSYPANDSHPDEKVTVAADPCDRAANCPFFRLPYVQHGFLPVRVIITNDSASPLALDDVRIQFISANHDVIPAALLEDLNRRLFSTKSAMGTKLPIIPITIHHPPVDRKVTEDDTDFGFNTATVAPHTTASGYLFYDIRDLDDPAMKNAELYVKMIRTADTKKQLFAFTVPFDKWLATNAGKEPSAKPAKQPPLN
jgi:hypothetical protein